LHEGKPLHKHRGQATADSAVCGLIRRSAAAAPHAPGLEPRSQIARKRNPSRDMTVARATGRLRGKQPKLSTT
jgi:hypothetical protein